MTPDVQIRDQGTIVLFVCMTSRVKDWLMDNANTELWQWLGQHLAVERRYASDLIVGLREAGFNTVDYGGIGYV